MRKIEQLEKRIASIEDDKQEETQTLTAELAKWRSDLIYVTVSF